MNDEKFDFDSSVHLEERAKAEISKQKTESITDRRMAYAVLRLTFGLNILLHGLVRLPNMNGFVEGLVKNFADTPLPSFAVRLFAWSLPPLEVGIGMLLLLGLFTRWALVAGGLVMTALVFGTALRSDWETLGLQMIYSVIYYLLLAARSDDYFSLDTFLAKR